MYSLILVFGGLIGFFVSIVFLVVAIAMASDLWLNVSAAVFGLSIAQFLAFVVIKE